MVIDQRGAIVSTDNTYVVDRFLVRLVNQTTQTFTAQQSSLASTTPPGFVNGLKYLFGGTAAAPGTNMVAGIVQKVEGLNCGDMKFGTADAKAILLSFWCKSSVTGTFGISFYNSAINRGFPTTYTISVANTWEYKTVAVPGDTSGTWLTTNGIGIQVSWDLGVGTGYSASATGAWQTGDIRGTTGTTKLCATTAGDFFLTGVKLELGTIATPFVPDDYQVSFAKCQRYFYKWVGNQTSDQVAVLSAYNTAGIWGKLIPFPVTMRAQPTSAYSAVGDFLMYNAASTPSYVPATIAISASKNGLLCNGGISQASAVFTAGQAISFQAGNSSAYLSADAEL
jgi:hypothetical protein